MLPIEIFYSFQCPYCYLALDRLCELEQKFDVKVLWQPFSAKPVGKNFNNSFAMPEEKLSYIKDDVARLARRMGMPLVIDPNWPDAEFDPDRSMRGAIIAGDMEVAMEYNIKVFHRWWGEGIEPNDHNFLIELCNDLDVDPNEFTVKINSADTRERVKGIYRRGKKLGIFEVPTVVIGEERFAGIDRIEMVEEKLASMELKRVAASRA